MGIIVKPYTLANAAIIYASEHNSNYDTLFNEINGNLDNANIKAAAGIEGSKLASKPSGVSASQINAKAVTGTEIANDGSDDSLRAINTDHIKNNAIIQRHLANDSVGTAEIINDNITTAKILAANVTHAKLKINQVDLDISGVALSNGNTTLISLGITSANKTILGHRIRRAGSGSWAGNILIYTIYEDTGGNLYLQISNPDEPIGSVTIAASTVCRVVYVEN